jgi:hypothetical protein
VPDELSFCAYVVALREPLQVADGLDHPVFRDNPAADPGGCRMRWPTSASDPAVARAHSLRKSPPEVTTEPTGVALWPE